MTVTVHLLYQIYANENRTLVPLNSIPKNLDQRHHCH